MDSVINSVRNSDTSIRDRIRNTNVPKITPSATTSIIFFLCITIIYAFMVIYTTISANSLSNVELSINNPIYTFIYILFLVTGTYFINVNVSKTICNENTIQWSRVLLITILPWIMIFGVLYFILELFPGWSSPFSNTFGWVIINALGATEVLERILKKYSPKATRVLKTNKAPVILDKEFALKQKPYSDLDLETIKKRAQMVRNNENFCKNIQIINREAAEEKEQTKTQEDLLPEETLYEKFIPNKDTALFKTWHSSSWEDKLRLLDKFQDKIQEENLVNDLNQSLNEIIESTKNIFKTLGDTVESTVKDEEIKSASKDLMNTIQNEFNETIEKSKSKLKEFVSLQVSSEEE